MKGCAPGHGKGFVEVVYEQGVPEAILEGDACAFLNENARVQGFFKEFEEIPAGLGGLSPLIH
jgi:hypothetical protein